MVTWEHSPDVSAPVIFASCRKLSLEQRRESSSDKSIWGLVPLKNSTLKMLLGPKESNKVNCSQGVASLALNPTDRTAS